MSMIGEAGTIAAEQEIRRLVSSYSDAVSGLDAQRAAAVYAEDGVVSIEGAAIVGRQAIEEGMRQTFSAFRLLQLIAHGGLVTVDGDRAAARWSTVELAVRQGSDDLGCIFGRYEDELVRLPEGWRFKRRVFLMAGRTRLKTDKLQLNPDFAALASALPLTLHI